MSVSVGTKTCYRISASAPSVQHRLVVASVAGATCLVYYAYIEMGIRVAEIVVESTSSMPADGSQPRQHARKDVFVCRIGCGC